MSQALTPIVRQTNKKIMRDSSLLGIKKSKYLRKLCSLVFFLLIVAGVEMYFSKRITGLLLNFFTNPGKGILVQLAIAAKSKTSNQ
ncbi:uncharacterized protein RJT20DRAFT_48774 [Scheffersomyces xylosifermentans]|uniref:uncharacterized protein n=1 Tax=Scheffersomyces xylosifermentans TaxID=1304137 RepID=UPI00315D1F95